MSLVGFLRLCLGENSGNIFVIYFCFAPPISRKSQFFAIRLFFGAMILHRSVTNGCVSTDKSVSAGVCYRLSYHKRLVEMCPDEFAPILPAEPLAHFRYLTPEEGLC